jgi:hypothetical protein
VTGLEPFGGEDSPVQHSPLNLTWIPLHQEGALAFFVDECENLSVGFHEGLTRRGVDFEPAELAKTDSESKE